jgi:pimeloyl-ACP methyl ester carboxylesterase
MERFNSHSITDLRIRESPPPPSQLLLPFQTSLTSLLSGTSIQITLPNGSHRSINVNCTSVPSSNGTSSPTIWIESSAAHGIVDFLGLAQHLTYTHSRNFCSYDPPNFGWSERLHSDYKNYYDYFFPMLEALGRGNEDIALVGWGGGVDNVVRHAIERPDIVKGLVLLDAAPAGIEWMDAQRANNWTEAEMLRYRSSDLSGRVELAQLILSLGIPW